MNLPTVSPVPTWLYDAWSNVGDPYSIVDGRAIEGAIASAIAVGLIVGVFGAIVTIRHRKGGN